MIGWLRRLRSGPRRHHAPVAESLEARLLFSADLGGVLAAGVDPAAAEVRTLDGAGEYTMAMAAAAVNEAPVAGPDSYVTEHDTRLVIHVRDLLANDSDAENDSLSIVGVTSGSGGSVTPRGGDPNVLHFDPTPGYVGIATFTYTVSDGVNTSTGTVTIVVGTSNLPPVGSPDVVDATEDEPVTYAPELLVGNDSDPEGNPLFVDAVGGAVGGTVILNADGTVTFVPDADFNGAASFWYTVSDGAASSAQVAVRVDVAPVNDVPTTAPVRLPDAIEDGGTIVITPADLLANASDVEGDPLTLTGLTASSGTLVANADGSWSFTPDADFNGTVTFSYAISDGAADTATTATLVVAPVNDPPSTLPVTLPAMAEDGTIVITPADLLANAADVDGDGLAVVNLTASSGNLVANADGTWSFTPDANSSGTVTFTYGVTDGTATAAGTASLLVTPVNDAPTTTPVSLPGMAEDGGTIVITVADLLANASDVEGTALTLTNLVASSGTLVANADGTWSFTPARDFNGTVSFTYDVGDGAATVRGTASLAVAPVPDAPVGGADSVGAVQDTPLTIAPGVLLANDRDADGSALAISGVTAGNGGSVALHPDGSITFRPDAGFQGRASFTYTVSDGALDAVVPVVVDVVAQDAQAVPVPPPPPAPPAPPAAVPPPPAAEAAPPPPLAASPAPEPPASAPMAPAAIDPVTAAPAPAAEGGSAPPPRAARAAESLQEALGPAMDSPVATLHAGSLSFGAAPQRLALQADGARALATVVFDRAGLQLISAQGPDFALTQFGIESRPEGTRLEDFQRSIRSVAFASELDRLREAVRDELDLEKSVTISVVSVSLGLSFVYVLWLIRGGVLLGSYLSALPAWRILDPLPVLARSGEEAEDEEEPLAADRPDGRNTLRGFG